MKDLHIFERQQSHLDKKKSIDGVIEKWQLNWKFECYFFDFKSLNDFDLYIDSELNSSFYICVNLSEKDALDLTMQYNFISIPPYASFLIPYKESNDLYVNGSREKIYNFIMLKINTKNLDAEELKLMDTLDAEGAFWKNKTHESCLVPNLEICELGRKLKNLNISTCENKFIASGYANILIGLKLKEFSTSNKYHSKLAYLRNHEIFELEKLTQHIHENPQMQYVIKDLCKKTGLSVSKLQAGFKDMHNCTVAIFIRNIRLEKALEMLKTTDLNVSEIVYSVGLNSRGYFCRIFKKKYKCSPKHFQQQLKDNMLTAS
ncbi:MAG: AraC family transcriptional regulator [Gelidibacter sp.]